MAFKAAWSFANESAVLLHNDMHWQINNTNSPTWTEMSSSEVYTYSGSPTRYSFGMYPGNTATPPAPFQPVSHQGCWAMPVKCDSAATVGTGIFMQHSGIGYGLSNYLSITSTNTVGLYVGSTFKGNSAPLDLKMWHYFCLKSDMSGTTWSGEMWIDGVQEVSATHAAVVQTISSFFFRSTTQRPGTLPGHFFGGLSYWTSTSDSAQTPMYATTVDPNEDLTNVGTWTQSGGPTTDHDVCASPLDTATKTTEASPTTGDRVQMGIKNGSTNDLTDALGLNPNSVVGVSLHTWSTGQAINAKAIIGHEADANETVGTASTVDVSNTTYIHVGSGTNPTGGAWTGASQPKLTYEID